MIDRPMPGALRPLLLAACLTLAGCGSLLHTPYETPDVTVPGRWNAPIQADGAPLPDAGTPDRAGASRIAAQPATAAELAADPWWQRFGDAGLDALVDTALLRNNDLAAAAIRVRRAQLATDFAQTNLNPTVSAGPNVSATRPFRDSASRSESYGVSASASWEADLWGRLGSQRDAAAWEARATEADRQSTALALVGTTMTLYWQSAFLNERIAVAQESIAYAQRTLDLVRGQYGAGAVSGLEVAEAESSLASQQANLSQLEQQQIESLNALAILLDGPPSQDVPVPARLPDGALPGLPAGVPADLLGRRPDLRAAELRLRGILADNDAVRASYYPRLTLTGSLGSVSSALANVLQNPIGTLGAGLILPFLNFNQQRIDNLISQVEYEEAVTNFRQTLYQAMSDVENALSARGALARQGELLQVALDSALRAEDLTEARYRAGAVNLRVWLDAQERRRAAEVAVSDNRLQQYTNQVLLYQALGGDAVLAQAPAPRV